MKRFLAALRRALGLLLGYEQELSRMRLVCNVLGIRTRFPGSMATASGFARELYQYALLNTPVALEVTAEARETEEVPPGVIRIVVEHHGRPSRQAEGA